ncbi:hypothetical protein CBR_g55441 [Chara braunii]|uniref:Uncharacterized protein n=1 Tax=Chara braunii TaxID=69332 RepID=A0A388K7S8_CHABU|nr:hypothetical protein CBR_g55441 [Chara braunii]|eukprot:GBG66098.1 hypothetical protein CBR_g55441 [Chara braunii]
MQCIRLFTWCCGCGRSAASASIQSRNIGGPFLERSDRFQREMETGITWYVHRDRHIEFGPTEALAHGDQCGLHGYWFYSVKELLNIVRSHLPNLKDEYRGGDERGQEIMTGGKLTMALESWFELSRAWKAWDTFDLFVSNETACFIQDLPQTSRCRHDIDAGRDFAQAEGYLAMLQVLICCPPDSVYAELAASTLAGFAAGLSVLPWQPDRDSEDTDFIINMLADDDFRYCTKSLLYVLLDLLEPYASGASDPTSVQKLRVQEAAASAICSFAHAASDVNALVHCAVGKALRASRHLNDDHPAMRGDFLSNQRTVSILLSCAQREASRNIAADCIRTLSWLWTRRVMYWHRHDLRMTKDNEYHRAQGATNAIMVEDLPPALADMGRDSREVNLQVLRRLLELCLANPTPFSAFSQLHLAKIFISQKVKEADTGVAMLLLECLIYWRRALGTRELDWFAIETIESLRDLLHVASEESKRDLKLKISKSPGGVDCLRLMFNPQVSRIRAVRFSLNMENFDQSSVDFLSTPRINSWSMTGNDHPTPCSAAAAGLLADLLEAGRIAMAGRDAAQQVVSPSETQAGSGASPRTPCDGTAGPSAPGADAPVVSGQGSQRSRAALGTLVVQSSRPSSAHAEGAQGDRPSGDRPSLERPRSPEVNEIGDNVTMVRAWQTDPPPRSDRTTTCRRVNEPGQDPRRVPVEVESILPDNPSQRRNFFASLFKSLAYILLAAERRGRQTLGSRQHTGCRIRIKNYGHTFFARMVLIFWASLGNPAWVPVIGLFEDLEAICIVDERMEVLEHDLNSLLATRNAIRVIKLVLEAYPPQALDARLVTVLIPPLVDLLRKPCARLHERLHLDYLENRCNADIRSGIVAVLRTVVGRIDELGSDPSETELQIDPALPSIARLRMAERWWLRWCEDNEVGPTVQEPSTNFPGGSPDDQWQMFQSVPVRQGRPDKAAPVSESTAGTGQWSAGEQRGLTPSESKY